MNEIICLDAGHYTNFNTSSVFPAYREGNMTFELYEYLKTELEKYGFIVYGTRENRDEDLKVYDRGYMAAGADLFISLHSNACDDSSIRRVVVITPFQDANGCIALGNKIGEAVTDCMGIDEKPQIYQKTYIDRGKEWDYYGVIRGAVAAGCKRSLIVEHSFHTNKTSAEWLYNSDNLKVLGKVLAVTIADYFGIEFTGEEMEQIKEFEARIKTLEDSVESLTKEIADLVSDNKALRANIKGLTKTFGKLYSKVTDSTENSNDT